MKVAICVPSGGSWAAEFGMALVGVLGSTVEHDLLVLSRTTSMHAVTRTLLAQDALATGADWFLWLDADMTFPPDLLRRMLAHRREILSCNCARRNRYPIETINQVDPNARGLLPAAAAGMAVMLTARSVFERTPAPWFEPHWLPEGQYVGEDVSFCFKARAAGFGVWIDADLSREIGHLGTAEYATAAKASSGGHPVLSPQGPR